MTATAGGPRVFLAAPFVQYLDPATGAVAPVWEQRLRSVDAALRRRGARVFNAHVNEDFGRAGLPPHRCVPSDYRALVACDAVLAFLGSPVSTGVCVELGWASALGRPVHLVTEPGTSLSPMVAALDTVTPVLHDTVEPGWPPAWQDALVERFLAWAAGRGPAATGGPWSPSGLDPALAYRGSAA